MSLNEKETIAHSKRAFEMWKPLWVENCQLNKPKIETSLKDILGKHRNQTAILFSYGPSFEKNVKEVLNSDVMKNRENYVITCVDKAFRPLCERGLQADYVVVADGSVCASTWLSGCSQENYKNSCLISNVYGSPGWSDAWSENAGNKNIFWYLNKDQIKTEEYFGPLVNYYDIIMAASNVANSMVVLTAQILGSKKILLFGFDYSFKDKYYGTTDNYKRWALGTEHKIDIHGDIIRNTLNMDFSAKWLEQYIAKAKYDYNTLIINYTNDGIIKGREAMEVETRIYK